MGDRNFGGQSEDTSFELTEHGFIQVCLEKFKELMPEATITQTTDKWNYDIKTGEKSGMSVYLGNIWDNYNHSKDIGVVQNFINVQTSLAQKIDSDDMTTINLDTVYPVIRQSEFSTSMNEKAKEVAESRLIADALTDELNIVYAQDHGNFVSFVMNNQLADGMTEDELSDRAFLNLKKQGWVEADEKIEVSKEATVLFFAETDKQFQAQFMVKEMYEKHLGDYFWVTFPTRDTAVAMQWHDSPDKHPEFGAHLAVTMKKQAVEMYSTMPNNLSHVIHRVSDGEFKKLG